MSRERKSDRWITPGVIIAAILVAGLVACVVAGGVTYLAARGVDPDPMLQLTAQVVTSLGVVGNVVLQLAGRSTAAKTERNTGQLVGVVADVAEVAAAPAPLPPPAPAPYVVDLEDYPPGTEQQRTPSPPPPPPPARHHAHPRS